MSKFCTKCGLALNEQELFCPSCGTKYMAPIQLKKATVKTVDQEETVVLQPIIEKAPKKKVQLWKKMALSFTLIIIGAAIGGHFAIKSMTKADKIVLPIFNALLDHDEDKFFAGLTLPKNVAYDALGYMLYIEAQQLDRFLQNMKEAANDVQVDGITRVIKHEDGTELFRVKEKKFLAFYPTVEIIPIDSNVLIKTDLVKGKISFNNKEHELKGANIDLGGFLPGDYQIEATTENAIIPHTAKWTFTVTTVEKVNQVPLTRNDVLVKLDGDHPDSIVFVNGTSTKKTLADLEHIGPVFGDTEVTISVEKKTPTGEMAKSFEEIVTGGSNVYFTYPATFSFIVKTPEEIAEETFDRDELKQFVIDFRDAYEKSLTSKKFAIIEPYLAPGSTASKEVKDFIGSIGNDYYDYNFTMNEVLSIALTVEEASVKTYEEFYFTNDNFDTVFYQRDKQYDIRIDNQGDYKVHRIHIFETNKN